MNAKKCKKLRRFVERQTIGKSEAETRRAYRRMKAALRRKPSTVLAPLPKRPRKRPQGVQQRVGQNPRREWMPGPLITTKRGRRAARKRAAEAQ